MRKKNYNNSSRSSIIVIISSSSSKKSNNDSSSSSSNDIKQITRTKRKKGRTHKESPRIEVKMGQHGPRFALSWAYWGPTWGQFGGPEGPKSGQVEPTWPR